METNRVPAGERIAIIEDDIPLRGALSLFLRAFSSPPPRKIFGRLQVVDLR